MRAPDRALRDRLRSRRGRASSPPGSTTPQACGRGRGATTRASACGSSSGRASGCGAAYPSPRYWDGMFDPEGFHLDPLALCRGYAAAAEGQGAPSVRGHARPRPLRARRRRWRVAHARRRARWPSAWSCARAPTRRALLPALARADAAGVHLRHRHRAARRARTPSVIRAPYAVYDNRFATGYYRLLPDGRLLWGGRISTQRAAARPRRPDAARSGAGLPAAGRRRRSSMPGRAGWASPATRCR